MASITGNKEMLAVSGGNSVYLLERKNGSLQTLEPPVEDIKITTKKVPKKGETSSEHADKHMACAALSSCGRYLALATCRGTKSLLIWQLEGQTWSLISQRPIGRAASKIRFTNSASRVLIADKAGDVYSFSVTEPTKEKEWLLGHIAMLLDVTVSDDEKYIISCDRDDKIRVARFPNCYNINSYCLGHTSFVTSLSFLPHNLCILVSSSGDGCIKLWKYLEGKELLSIPINKYVPALDGEILPIKQCSVFQVSPEASLMSVCIGSSSKCPIFKIDGTDNLQVKLLCTIGSEDQEVWCTQFTKDNSMLLMKNNKMRPVEVWSWDENYDFLLNQNETELYEKHSDTFQECFSCPSIPSMLYRKNYDEPADKVKKHS
ncbi:tRNA (guanine-N(7)-)-methyltransferase non-catalytic subunit wdr4 [Cloeon dipterum]|uniref:tRNA (guanine-N(7)-)-methyltransferase non-catalytic subunit wdr4 n=1 Tax=Cloeon dipterum TaxID=197152 RepID=UPI003220491D